MADQPTTTSTNQSYLDQVKNLIAERDAKRLTMADTDGDCYPSRQDDWDSDTASFEYEVGQLIDALVHEIENPGVDTLPVEAGAAERILCGIDGCTNYLEIRVPLYLAANADGTFEIRELYVDEENSISVSCNSPDEDNTDDHTEHKIENHPTVWEALQAVAPTLLGAILKEKN